jgi:hypothetical protein
MLLLCPVYDTIGLTVYTKYANIALLGIRNRKSEKENQNAKDKIAG